MKQASTILLALMIICGATSAEQPDPSRLAEIDRVVLQGIKEGKLPGAVILVTYHDKVIFRKAYGFRTLEPRKEKLTPDDHLFDLASLTKPIATATSVMKLIEQGKVRLRDPIVKHLPELKPHGKDGITVEQLLLHTAGFIPDNPLADYRDGPKKAWARICDLKPVYEPGEDFRYTDVGFIVLGKLVEKVGGMPLDRFAQKHVFAPLGMRSTTFNPGGKLAERAVPTEKVNGEWLQGVVHDPRSRLMGGVAGHAGLFSTAEDLAIYARMLLHQGLHEKKPILSGATVKLMTTARKVPKGLRALGWDVRTSYSRNRGKVFGEGSFGHTGFTGTSIWIDPKSDCAVIFLSSRLHPDGKGNVVRLRGEVSTIVASSLPEYSNREDR